MVIRSSPICHTAMCCLRVNTSWRLENSIQPTPSEKYVLSLRWVSGCGLPHLKHGMAIPILPYLLLCLCKRPTIYAFGGVFLSLSQYQIMFQSVRSKQLAKGTLPVADESLWKKSIESSTPTACSQYDSCNSGMAIGERQSGYWQSQSSIHEQVTAIMKGTNSPFAASHTHRHKCQSVCPTDIPPVEQLLLPTKYLLYNNNQQFTCLQWVWNPVLHQKNP